MPKDPDPNDVNGMVGANAFLDVLKSLADGQRQMIEEIKKLGEKQELVPLKMPDGSIQAVPRSSLMASTQGQQSKLKAVEHEPLTREPWPDPATPTPRPVR